VRAFEGSKDAPSLVAFSSVNPDPCCGFHHGKPEDEGEQFSICLEGGLAAGLIGSG
jgi:hypothetical protein